MACHVIQARGLFCPTGEYISMKLHESVRKVIRQFGANVLSEKRLLFILSDFSAFDEYPAMRQVIEAIVEDGSGKEICRLFLNDDTDWCRSYAQNLRKSLSEKNHFREDIAGYAVDSILFGLGLQSSVREPSGHGFDPIDHGSGAGSMGAGAGAPQPGGAPSGGPQAPGGAGNGSGPAPGGSAAPGGGSAPSGNGGGPSFRMKWIAAAVLLAGVFAIGRCACSPSVEKHAAAPRESPSIVERQPAAVSSDAVDHTGQYEYEQGEKYYYGRGVDRNYARAFKWYRKAADKGHKDAEYRIGWMWERGLGVPTNDSRAVEWYRKAAAHGNKDAQSRIEILDPQCSGQTDAGQQPGQCEYELGEKYYNGYEVNGNDRKALDWYMKAAEKGNSAAEYKIGWMYEHGYGVTRIYGIALRWYRKAAEHGNQDAQAGIERVVKLIQESR